MGAGFFFLASQYAGSRFLGLTKGRGPVFCACDSYRGLLAGASRNRYWEGEGPGVLFGFFIFGEGVDK